jgi:hypothetical protein
MDLRMLKGFHPGVAGTTYTGTSSQAPSILKKLPDTKKQHPTMKSQHRDALPYVTTVSGSFLDWPVGILGEEDIDLDGLSQI